MGFEALVDLPTKTNALQELVDGGILTKHDLEVCVKALSSKATDNGVVYKDKFISVTYKGFKEQNTLGGRGIKVNLIIENKTPEILSLRARKCVNGIIVEKDENISVEIPEKSKVIASTTFYYEALNVIDVNSVEDIDSISFWFRCVDKRYKEVDKARKPITIKLNA